jgi:hypothetical protein
VYAPIATGSIANGNLVLYTYDFALPSVATNSTGGSMGAIGFGSSYFNSTLIASQGGPITQSGTTPCVYRYTIGSGSLPWNNVPDLAISTGINNNQGVVGDVDVAPDGKIFITCNRAAAGGAPWLAVYDSSGQTNLFCSDDSSSDDTVLDSASAAGAADIGSEGAYSVKVSPDEKYVAIGGYEGWIGIYSLVNGLPNPTTFQFIPFDNGFIRVYSVAWDAADNVYGLDNTLGALFCYDIGQTETCVTSNDSTGLHGSFTITVPPVTASVTATTPLAYQANNSYQIQNFANSAVVPAVFTITLDEALSSSLSVYFTLTGTATNVVNYTATTSAGTLPAAASNVVVFPAHTTSETVTITPTANPSSGVSLSVILSLLGGTTYGTATPSVATASIANSGPQELSITGVVAPGSMYRGVTNDFASFIITRYGDTNFSTYTIPVNAFTLTGTAMAGVDYAGILSPVTVTQGDQTETAYVTNPVCKGVYVGNETIVATLNGNSPQTVVGGPANLTLVDNMYPPAQVLWSDSLQSAADSVNWTLTFANSNMAANAGLPILIENYPNYTPSNPDPNAPGSGNGLDDFDVEFGYSLANDGVTPSPLMGLNGESSALKMTVNKVTSYVDGHGASAGVNVYPQGMKFSGNYAFRFSMCLSEGSISTTEFNLFGINHYGTNCNWFGEDVIASEGTSTTNSDGVWYWVDTDVDGSGNAGTYTEVAGGPLPDTGWTPLLGTLAASGVSGLVAPFNNYFKNPGPYTCSPAGAPANFSDSGSVPVNAWADVEVKQVNNIISLSINKFLILSYTNSTNSKSGDVMLGYDDPYASIGTVANSALNGGIAPYFPGASVYYANAQVVQLGPYITSTALSGTSLTINFTDSDTGDTAASFEIVASSTVNGTYTAIPATISPTTPGSWSAVVSLSGSPKFYQVVRINY